MAIRNITQEQRAQLENLVRSKKYTQYAQIARELGLNHNDVRNYIKNRPALFQIFYETQREAIAEKWGLENGIQ